MSIIPEGFAYRIILNGKGSQEQAYYMNVKGGGITFDPTRAGTWTKSCAAIHCTRLRDAGLSAEMELAEGEG